MADAGGGADALSWGTVIAGLAIVVNLGWNLGNTLHTRRVAHRIRIEKRQTERWDRLRSRIETNLDAFIVDVKSAHMILAKATSEPEKSKVIEWIDFEIALKQDALAKALEEADRSDCCEAKDWALLANGPAQYAGETSWDMIITVIACAANMTENRVQHLKRLNKYADDIELAVREALEAQDNILAPKSKKSWSLRFGISKNDE